MTREQISNIVVTSFKARLAYLHGYTVGRAGTDMGRIVPRDPERRAHALLGYLDAHLGEFDPPKLQLKG